VTRGRALTHPSDPTEGAAAAARRPIARAVEILEVLTDAAAGLGVTEVARRTGLPKSTAARLLNELTEIGMVARVGHRYQQGPRFRNLIQTANTRGAAGLRRMLMPAMLALHDETGLDVAFATLDQGRVLFETALYGPERAQVLSSVPLSTPAYCTCSGKVLLAYSPVPAVGEPLTAHTDRTITDPAQLARELVRIRRDGIAYNDGEYIDGLSSLAVPVFGPRMRLVGSLALCGSANAVDVGRVRAALSRAARSASAAIR
jgi:IclR family transcriptional regulator, KDG regulon repressor